MSEETPTVASQPTLRGMLARGHLRLVLFAVLLAAVSLTVSGAFLIRGYAIANVALTARTISYTVEPAVLFGDRRAVAHAISSVGSVGSIAGIEVVDASGDVLADWQKPQNGMADSFEAAVTDALWAGPQEAPIIYDGRRIGTVRIFGSAEAMLRYALSGLIIALCCLGLTIIATRILARRLEEDVVAPLEHVGEIAHEVRSQRAFERRVEPSGIAEIDRLGRDFNALLAELQSWHDTLTSENIELAHKAEHDPLTGLGNRERFERMLESLVRDASENDGRFALLYVDTDNFKEINDTLGHDVGDMALCAIAERLRHSVRAKDRVFRLGGDEFAVLLDRAHDTEELQRVVDRIQTNVSAPFSTALKQERTLEISVGSAIYPDDGDTPRGLFRAADRRMYENKNKGRGDENQG